ncbi:MAG: protein-L-isoaspartate O-methyltransferase [Euryarchaeota archaeon]|nr:protein-L-isoaspartate O-methyltransferase [Euryarchaeota archaeon]
MEREVQRRILINSLQGLGIRQSVLDAMMRVPRHLFVPENVRSSAYMDTPLPIGHGQTISAPHMVAIMCDLLDLRVGQKVLEIGTGSGYNAAIMAELVGKEGHIYSIERVPQLVDFAKKNLEAAGYENVSIILEDGSGGSLDHAPYDRINVTSAAPSIPDPLVQQLSRGGIMTIPVGNFTQRLYIVRKDLDGPVHKEDEGGVVFVPLIGKYGFPEHE